MTMGRKEDFEPVIIPHSAMQDGYGSTTLDVYGNLYLGQVTSVVAALLSHIPVKSWVFKLDQEPDYPSGTIGYSYNSGSDVQSYP